MGCLYRVIYKNNKLFKAITRGDGVVGEEITENVLGIRGIPKLLKIVSLIL